LPQASARLLLAVQLLRFIIHPAMRLVSLSALLLSASALRKGRKGSSETASAGGKVVTLGDSYSSGTGIHKSGRDYEGGECWRDWKTTPGSRYAAFEGLEGVNMACKGDEVPGILQQFEQLHAQNPEDFASGWANSTFLFTIGGNDLRTGKGESWPDLLKSCIMSFYGACHEKAENQIVNFNELEATLTELYTKVAQEAPNARIRVLGYPQLLQRKWLCIPVPGLALGAADWADKQVDELNRRLRAAVASVKSGLAANAEEIAKERPAAMLQEASEGSNSLLGRLLQRAKAKGMGATDLEKAYMRKGSRRRRDRRRATPAPAPTPPGAVDIEFVDVKSYFSKGACRFFDNEVHAIVLDGFSLSDASFHPSQRGYNKYYEALGNSLGRSLPPPYVAPFVPDQTQLGNMLEGWDTNQNGTLELEEALAMMQESPSADAEQTLRSAFAQADTAGTGSLNLAGFQEFLNLYEKAEAS